MTRLFVQPKRFENDFNAIFNNIFNHANLNDCHVGDGKTTAFSPNVNVVEHDDSFALTFELPGMDKADIKVLVKDDVLTVSGERKVTNEVKTDGYFRSEISSGAFSRSFNVPENVMSDSINADYKNGMLQVVLSKKEETIPKEIEVSVS